MASEWARKKAEEIIKPDGTGLARQLHDAIAAALDEARAEGRAEALGDAIPLKDLMAEALAAARAEGRAEGERIGAELERWECHRIAVSARHAVDAAEAISRRGPMRGPEEG